ncbi:hypothetical protein NVP1177O_18 [Vibrio phage 1.177.O._10N.286.45.E10]|nr:hypothetical protein NVP1177O_18 [Vibrio phage 1.177.O._10N.286.45.E10]
MKTDLDAYIANMQSLLDTHNEIKQMQKENGHIDKPGSDGIKMMIEFSIKTATKFKESSI